jgi:hypothetical protein
MKFIDELVQKMKFFITLIIIGFLTAAVLSVIFPYWETWLFIPLILIPIISTIIINNYFFRKNVSIYSFVKEKYWGKIKAKQLEVNQTNSLSEKYAILHIFKSILWIVLILDIIGVLIAVIKMPDFSTEFPVWVILIYGIVWIFGLFGIFCGIKIIDFIFDLDKVKSDKV